MSSGCKPVPSEVREKDTSPIALPGIQEPKLGFFCRKLYSLSLDIDLTSGLESMAAHHQHVETLKTLEQISPTPPHHAGDYRPLAEVSSGFFGPCLSFFVEIRKMAVKMDELLCTFIAKCFCALFCGSSHHRNNNRATMQKRSSWITALTFPGCLLLTNYRPYSSLLCKEPRPFFNIWLPLLGMLNCTVFVYSLYTMVICGARFTPLHGISALLLYSFFSIITGGADGMNCN